ncbi:dienelactone hydrolase family protein [Tateyamaria omphalii]|uniref:dienelactone hydrolase family protein n=1 Tax=Tateyamaria omphalii TaxID=299262 RepID=UPI001C98F881|nr:dienelactone hydrolase family protein [Tateyamaria omphalii]MBY5935254.1 dienelactone hydrolase family protein [Tateyamaria omphalii]
MSQAVDLSAFHSPVSVGTALSLPVYVSKTGDRPLVVLHELPGMSPSFVDYCTRMTGEGFKVYMPLLFKAPGTEMGMLGCAAFCLSREFRALFAASGPSRARPIAAWILELVQKVAEDNPGAAIGTIGMCMTGGFAIVGIADPRVQAVVACQPSAPFFREIETLGLSEAERDSVRAGKTGKTIPCAKAYRYEKDRISREAHMRAAQDLLGPSLHRYPDLPGKGHATLTTQTASPEVYADVLTFLNARL